LLDSANNFDGGAENGGITITVADIFDEQSARVRVEYQRAWERPGSVPQKGLLRP